MKLLLCLLLPVISFAHVGDKAAYDLKVSDTSAQVTFEVLDHNSDDLTYTVSTLTEVNGKSTTEKETLTEDDLMTPEAAVTIVLLCMALGGENETINDMATCKLTTESVLEMRLLDNIIGSNLRDLNTSTVWIGNVPVHGIVRLETAEGAVFTLKSHSYAN